MKVFSFAILAAAAASASASAVVASLRGSDEQMKRDLEINDISVNVNLPDEANALDVDFDLNAGGNGEDGGGLSASRLNVGIRNNGGPPRGTDDQYQQYAVASVAEAEAVAEAEGGSN